MPGRIKDTIVFISGDPSSNDFLGIPFALITAIFSALIAYLLARYNYRKTQRKGLDEQLDDILKIGVQYPYVELSSFTEKWDREKLLSRDKDEAERYQRYDIYANLVFNYMERVAEHYHFSEKRIQKHVDLKNWIKTHEKIWNNPTDKFENTDAYSKKFIDLVQEYLKDSL